MPAIVAAASDYLETHLDMDNCLDVVTLAETFSLDRLKRTVYRSA